MENTIKERRLAKLAEIRATLDSHVSEFNKLLGEDKNTAEVDSKIATYKREWNKQKELAVYDEFLAQANPMFAAISKPSYYVVGIKDEKEDGVVSSRKVTDDNEKRIDLLKFIEYGKLDKTITREIEVFNHRLTLRAAEDLDMSESERQIISDRHHLSDAARKRFTDELSAKKDPTSNNSITSQMQVIADKILYVDDGMGKNKIKCLSHDAKFLVMTYTKKGKTMLQVKAGNPQDVADSLTQSMFRILTNKGYSLDYKADKTPVTSIVPTESASEAPKAPETPAASAAPETPAAPAVPETPVTSAAPAPDKAVSEKTTGKKSGKKGDKAVAA